MDIFNIAMLRKIAGGGNTGGGGDAGGSAKMTGGSFTIIGWPGSSTYEFEHGLGVRPIAFAIFTLRGSASMSTDDVLAFVGGLYRSANSINCEARMFHGLGLGMASEKLFRVDPMSADLRDVYGISCDDTKITIDMTEKNILLRNGYPYYWVALSEEAFA